MPENHIEKEEKHNGLDFQGTLAHKQNLRLSVHDLEEDSSNESQTEGEIAPSADQPDVESGSISRTKHNFPERFEIVGELGSGGMSVVYQAIDHQLEEPFNQVALKVLHESLASDPTVAKRFAHEVEVVSRLNHPNIVKIEGVGTTDSGLPFIELELVEGISLSELLTQQEHLSPYHACRIAYQICEALEHALSHGVIHRDVKPSNILVSKAGDEYIVKVLDFGIAKTLERDIGTTSGLTRTGDIFGSPAYMSPEQCTGGKLDTRSDIYSLGCVIYEMLTGVNPFAADNPIKSILKHVEDKAEPFEIEFSKLKIPKPLEKIVLKCLDKSQEKRYINPTELKRRLSRILGQDPLPWWELQLRKVHSNLTDFIIVGLFLAFTYHMFPEWLQVCYCGAVLFFYYALSEFSIHLRGTPGKALSKLQVCTPDGKSMSIAQSCYRVACLTPIVILFAVSCNCIESLSILELTKGFEPFAMLALFIGAFTLFDKLCGRRITRRATVLTPMKNSRLMEFQLDKNRKIAGMLALCAIPLCLGLSKIGQDLETRVNNDPSIQWENVLYATKDVPEGTKIPADGVAVKRVLLRKKPNGAVEQENDAVGKIAKYGVSAGQIITSQDLEQTTKP